MKERVDGPEAELAGDRYEVPLADVHRGEPHVLTDASSGVERLPFPLSECIEDKRPSSVSEPRKAAPSRDSPARESSRSEQSHRSARVASANGLDERPRATRGYHHVATFARQEGPWCEPLINGTVKLKRFRPNQAVAPQGVLGGRRQKGLIALEFQDDPIMNGQVVENDVLPFRLVRIPVTSVLNGHGHGVVCPRCTSGMNGECQYGGGVSSAGEQDVDALSPNSLSDYVLED
ncbi:hypothetical protein GCM10027415_01890 [Humibacter ginsengisoli]